MTPDDVARLVASAFPRWAGLPVREVAPQGNDHRSYRLGDDLVVRLPSALGYVPQLAKEVRWLPHLAASLPVPVPEIVAEAGPSEDFPWPWSVRRWLPGQVLSVAPAPDPAALARDLGGLLTAVRAVPAEGGPVAGEHSAHRGGPLGHYADEARQGIAALPRTARRVASEVLAEALATRWTGPPVWFHGDVAAGNLLLREGRLAALLDYGCAGVGDPACDVVPAWTLFGPADRTTFRARLDVDDDTWARGRGWALWKAVIGLDDPTARSTLDAVLG